MSVLLVRLVFALGISLICGAFLVLVIRQIKSRVAGIRGRG